jgi:gamma-glutamylcyclotransferase (GGCT)/AIG2-like uncharacterized protein YtfP
VLDVVPKHGKLVQGVVFEVTKKGWAALDKKEGAPCAYRQVRTECLTIDGRSHPVTVYEVNEDKRESFVAPSEEYVAVVRQGMKDFDLPDDSLVAACENIESPDLVEAIFVYGTLLRGECRHHHLKEMQPECILLAETRGRLLDFDEYPGLVPDPGGSPVLGEFVRVRSIGEALRRLDLVEDFRGFGAAGSLFRRAVIEVGMCDGRTRLAWVYVAGDALSEGREIDGGNWRASRDRWTMVLKRIVRGHVGNLSEQELASRVVNSRCFGGSEQEITELLPLDVALVKNALSERQLAQASGRWAVSI